MLKVVPGKRRLLHVAALAAVAVIALPLLQSAAAGPHRGPDQTRLILRLSDLPLGYLNLELQEEQGDDVYCSRLTHPEDTPPKMGKFILRYHPRGCIGAFYRLYTLPGEAPGPAIAATGALALGSDRAADAGWAVVPEILGRLLGDRVPKEVKAKERVGRATRLFHARLKAAGLNGRRPLGTTTSFLVWRTGNTLAAVEVLGNDVGADDRMAAALARLQQAHIRKPTRYTRAERFDGEVPLDDPAVDLPVYWLGRNFSPGGNLPANRLFDSYFTGEASKETHEKFVGAEAPGAPLNIRYENIQLATWTPANWHVFANSDTGRAITDWKCTQTRTIPFAEGTATIFGGYKKDFKRCPKEPPKAFTAWVDAGGVKVVVNPPFAPDFIETVNPYGSFEGMEAIVHSLTLRPKRVS